MIKKQTQKHQSALKWYRLDNAAKIYPSIITRRLTTVFRLSVTLHEQVHNNTLQKALNAVIGRFPYYQVRLRHGLFWHYLEQLEGVPKVRVESRYPCRKFTVKEDGCHLFRVLYFKKKIIVEFSHILTDGTGALVFLKALVVEYLVQTGEAGPVNGDIFRPDQKPALEEFEDSYKRYYKKEIPAPPGKKHAFHCNGQLAEKSEYSIITGIVPLDTLKPLADSYGVTLTEFIAGVYMYVLYDYIHSLPAKERKKHLRPVRLMIPVNLRKMYPSQSMRNFFLAVTPGIDPRLGEYTLADVIKEVHHYMRVEVNERFINQQIKRNVQAEQHPLVRMIPLFIKSRIEKMLYNRIATSQHSGVMTNLGKADLPDELAKHIERFEFVPNPNPLTKINFALISFNGNVIINFASLLDRLPGTGSSCAGAYIERKFFTLLRKMGVPVKIESNR